MIPRHFRVNRGWLGVNWLYGVNGIYRGWIGVNWGGLWINRLMVIWDISGPGSSISSDRCPVIHSLIG